MKKENKYFQTVNVSRGVCIFICKFPRRPWRQHVKHLPSPARSSAIFSTVRITVRSVCVTALRCDVLGLSLWAHCAEALLHQRTKTLKKKKKKKKKWWGNDNKPRPRFNVPEKTQGCCCSPARGAGAGAGPRCCCRCSPRSSSVSSPSALDCQVNPQRDTLTSVAWACFQL